MIVGNTVVESGIDICISGSLATFLQDHLSFYRPFSTLWRDRVMWGMYIETSAEFGLAEWLQSPCVEISKVADEVLSSP